MGITQTQCITYLLMNEAQDTVKQVIYYPHLAKVL